MTESDKKSHAIEMNLLMQFPDIKDLDVKFFSGTHIVTWLKDGFHTKERITEALDRLRRYSK